MRDEKSGITIYVDWFNPYENRLIQDHELVYIPDDVVEQGVKAWAKDNYNIDFNGSLKDMIDFFEDCGVDWLHIDSIDSLALILKSIYQKTDDYKKDCAEFLDEYELLNDLGKYAPEDSETIEYFNGD